MEETRYNIILQDDDEIHALVLTNLTFETYNLLLDLHNSGWLNGQINRDEDIIIDRR